MNRKSAHCPVCAARFRAEPLCLRCGADLSPLMALQIAAYLQRRAARAALAAQDLPAARIHAEAAQDLHATGSGAGLALLVGLLTP